MSKERILWKSEASDKLAKKANKKLADLCKDTIKELGCVEVYSKKTNQKIGEVKNKEEILPFWGSVDFTLSDPIPEYELSNNGIIVEIVYGTIFNSKKEEIKIVDKIFV